MEIGFVDLIEVPAAERVDAELQLRAQRWELELVLPPALLQHADRTGINSAVWGAQAASSTSS